MIATKGNYIHVLKKHKACLSKKQLNQLLMLIDPWHPPEGTSGSHRNTMLDRAIHFTKMKSKLNKRKNVLGICKLEAEPPVDQNAQMKRVRMRESGCATTVHGPAPAPNSPTNERPSQKPCLQPSPGRREVDSIRLEMSKMNAELANVKSMMKAQNKKGTAIEQEADENNKLRLSAHWKILSGTLALPFQCPLLSLTYVRLCGCSYSYRFFIFIFTFNNTRTCTLHIHTNMRNAQQATG